MYVKDSSMRLMCSLRIHVTLFFVSMIIGYYGCYAQSDATQFGKQLIEASHNPDTNVLKKVLRAGAMRYQNNPKAFLQFITTRDFDGWTALIHAASQDDAERLSILIDTAHRYFGNDIPVLASIINAQGKRDRTALMLAVEHHGVDAVKILLKKAQELFGTNKQLFLKFLNLPESSDHWTALMLAVDQSAAKIVSLLVEKAIEVFGKESPELDAFLNAQDSFGRTALQLTIDPWDRILLKNYGGKEIIKIESALDEEYTKLAQEMVHIISNRGHIKQLQAILERAKEHYKGHPNAFLEFLAYRDSGGWTSLMNAAADGYVNYVHVLLKAAEDFFKNNPEYVGLYLSYADIHARTAFQLATQRRHLNVVRALLDHHQKTFGNEKNKYYHFVNAHNELNGFTPLITASYNNQYTIARLLVDRALEVLEPNTKEFYDFLNFRDPDGFTALQYATDKRIYELLKKYGAK